MDPLSITASTITLIQVSGIVATALAKFATSMRTVDSRLTSLCDELASLSGFLQAIENTLKTCHKLDLDQIDGPLLQQSEVALANCQTTLNEMIQLVNSIKVSSRRRRVFWKARAVIDLNVHGDELVFYREKIHQSNAGLQTLLHAINVSLSIRCNAAQSLIALQLSRLKASIDEALYASFGRAKDPQADGPSSPDGHVSRNLQQLAEAAQSFHATASSTAGTVQSNNSERLGLLGSCIDASLDGRVNSLRKEQLERYLTDYTFESPSSVSTSRDASPQQQKGFYGLSSINMSRPHFSSTINEVYLGDDDDNEFEHEYLNCLKELALDSIGSKNYERAVQFLEQALGCHAQSNRRNQDHQSLQTQLALCHILQQNWKVAEPLVRQLLENSDESNVVISNLLHGIALGYLEEFAFDDALRTCKLALSGKKRLCIAQKAEWRQYNETLALLWTIFNINGDYIRAEIIHRRLPPAFDYFHPKNAAFFIEAQKDYLLSEITKHGRKPETADVQSGLQDEARHSSLPKAIKEEQESRLKSLARTLMQHEKYELDTAKECIYIHHAPSWENNGDDRRDISSASLQSHRLSFEATTANGFYTGVNSEDSFLHPSGYNTSFVVGTPATSASIAITQTSPCPQDESKPSRERKNSSLEDSTCMGWVQFSCVPSDSRLVDTVSKDSNDAVIPPHVRPGYHKVNTDAQSTIEHIHENISDTLPDIGNLNRFFIGQSDASPPSEDRHTSNHPEKRVLSWVRDQRIRNSFHDDLVVSSDAERDKFRISELDDTSAPAELCLDSAHPPDKS